MDKQLVFTYGTLMKGNRFHHILEDAEFIGSGTVKGIDVFSADGGRFPMAKIGEGIAVGEVYNVTQREMNYINGLECYNPNSKNNTFYDRKIVIVNMENGTELEAFIYISLRNVDGMPKTESNTKWVATDGYKERRY